MSTVAERLDMIAESGHTLAFDGCHKIFVMMSEEDRDLAFGNGYGVADFHPAEKIYDLWAMSCPLRLVHPMDLSYQPWDIGQGEQ